VGARGSPYLAALAVRLRLAVARRPVLRTALVVVLAAGAALLAHGEVRRATSARHAWGATTSVVVALVDIAPGDVLDGANTAARDWPLALAPAGAPPSLPDLATAAHPIAAGQVVVAAQLAGGDGVGLVPAGRRGVAVALGSTPLPVEPGARVDVVGGGSVLATAAPVVSVLREGNEPVAVVAVRDEELVPVASALANAEVVLALTP